MAKKKYRVLRDIELDGIPYKPDSVLVLDEKIGNTYEQAGALDSDKTASAYAEKELGAKVVTHKAKEDEDAEAPPAP